MISRRALLAGGLVLAAFSAAAGLFHSLGQRSNEPGLISIQGLPENGFANVELFSPVTGGASFKVDSTSGPVSIPPVSSEALRKPYYLTYQVSGSDIVFQINPLLNTFRISAQGLKATDFLNVRTGSARLASDVPPDWSGRIEFGGKLPNRGSGNGMICADIGGSYRDALSLCHDTGLQITPVQLGGGGGDDAALPYMIARNWVAGLQRMTQQLTTVMMQQMQVMGTFFDGKQQLELQRLFQSKLAKAHRDYYPGESMCQIGTMVRDLAVSDGRATLAKSVINENILGRELVSGDRSTVTGDQSNLEGRLADLRERNCNPDGSNPGSKEFCAESEGDKSRRDRDVNFTELVSLPSTIDADFLDSRTTKQEQDLFTMINGLYANRGFEVVSAGLVTSTDFSQNFMDMRSIVAMRGVARNSIASIVAMKTAGPSRDNSAGQFMKELMKEMQLSDEEIESLLGKNPSYFAQMDVLTKKIYQNPTFYTNLYDKPANIQRMRASMSAIKTMQDRDIYNALLRREMLISMLLELQTRELENPTTPAALK